MRSFSEQGRGSAKLSHEECGICLEQIGREQSQLSCHHFHRECLEQHIRSQLKQRIFPLRCPEENCAREIPVSLIEHIEPTIAERSIEASLQQYVTANRSRIVFCPGVDCRYLFEYVDSCKLDRVVRLKVCLGCLKPHCKCRKSLVCPCCNTTICLICQQSHQGLSCEQHRWNQKIDKDFNKFVECLRRHSLRKCPKCHSWVEKSNGCNHMVCRCHYQFCYRCNGPYGTCVCISNPKKEVNVTHIYPRIKRPYRGVTSGRPVKTLPATRRQPTKPAETSQLKAQKFPFWVRMMKNKQA